MYLTFGSKLKPWRLERRIGAQEVLGDRGGVIVLRAVIDAEANLCGEDQKARFRV